MKSTGYFTTEAPVRNEYKETLIDIQKKQADMLLTSIDGNWYSLFLNKDIKISGRGVKVHSEKSISVTEKVYDRLKSEYRIDMDF